MGDRWSAAGCMNNHRATLRYNYVRAYSECIAIICVRLLSRLFWLRDDERAERIRYINFIGTVYGVDEIKSTKATNKTDEHYWKTW